MDYNKKQGSDHLAPGTLILRLFAPGRFDIGNIINEDSAMKQKHQEFLREIRLMLLHSFNVYVYPSSP